MKEQPWLDWDKMGLTPDARMEIRELMPQLDFDAFMAGTTPAKMRKAMTKAVRPDEPKNLVPIEFIRWVAQNDCKWFGRRLKPVKKKYLPKPTKFGVDAGPDPGLTNEQWDHIKATIATHADLIKGRSLADAMRIIRTACSVNAEILMNLPKRWQLWSK